MSLSKQWLQSLLSSKANNKNDTKQFSYFESNFSTKCKWCIAVENAICVNHSWKICSYASSFLVLKMIQTNQNCIYMYMNYYSTVWTTFKNVKQGYRFGAWNIFKNWKVHSSINLTNFLKRWNTQYHVDKQINNWFNKVAVPWLFHFWLSAVGRD